jgi:hypothetical protein
MAKPIKKPSESELREALEQVGGNISSAHKWLQSQGWQIGYQAVYNLVDEYNLREYARSWKTLHANLAYDKLMDKVEEGDMGAIQMVLRSLGKKVDFIPEQTVLDYKHQLELEKLNHEKEQNRELAEALERENQALPHQRAYQRFQDSKGSGRSHLEDE